MKVIIKIHLKILLSQKRSKDMIHQKSRVFKTENNNLKKPILSPPSNKDMSTNQSRSIFNPKRYLKPALTEQQVKQIKDIFDIFDTQGRGLVHGKDLIDALKTIGYSQKENTVYQQLLDLSADGEGQIEFEKFLTMLTTKVTEQDSQSDMKQLFSLFDDEKCGYLTIKNLRRSVRQMGIDVQESQLQKMIEVADLDKDGRINEEQFFMFMTGKTHQE